MGNHLVFQLQIRTTLRQMVLILILSAAVPFPQRYGLFQCKGSGQRLDGMAGNASAGGRRVF